MWEGERGDTADGDAKFEGGGDISGGLESDGVEGSLGGEVLLGDGEIGGGKMRSGYSLSCSR